MTSDAVRLMAERLFATLLRPQTQRILLSAFVLFVFWDGLFGGAPRSDQIFYLHQVSELRSLADIVGTAPSWNRTHSAGDLVLYRPLLYVLLGALYYAFGYNFVLWQLSSVVMHIAVVLGLLELLSRGCLGNSLWPLLLSLFFAGSYFGAELVLWQHIIGYVLFAALRIAALICLIWYIDRPRTKFIALSVALAFASNLTYEPGALADLLIAGLFLLRLCKEMAQQHGPHPKRLLRSTNLWIALSFLLIAALPSAIGFVDLRLRGLDVPQSVYFKSWWDVMAGVYFALQQVLFWFGSWILPTVFEVDAGSRATFTRYDFGVSMSHLINYLAAALAVSGGLAFSYRLARRRDRTTWALLAATLGFLSGYSLIIAAGRTLPVGDMLVALRANIYYAYLPFLTAVVGVALLSIRFQHTGIEERIGSALRQRPPWHRLFGTGLAANCAAAGVVILTVLNAGEVMALAHSYRREFTEPRRDLFAALAQWHARFQDRDDAYFVVPDRCPGNDRLPWFKEHYRRKSGWTAVPTLADALYPDKSYNLNKAKLSGRGVNVSPIACIVPLFDIRELGGRWWFKGERVSIAVNKEGRARVHNEHGDVAEAMIGNGRIVVPAWQVTGEVTASKSAILWSNGSVWTR